MSETPLYKDELLSIRVPAYLRRKKPDARAKEAAWYFVVDHRQRNNSDIDGLLITFVSKEMADAIRFNLLTLKPTDWHGVEQKIVRRGEPVRFPEGLELLSSSHNTINGDVNYRYNLLFQSRGDWVHVDISGQNNLIKFDALCQEITSSIHLTGNVIEVSAKERRSINGGLSSIDKVRLNSALDELPFEIDGLRKPILAIAKQDLDLLGAGEADTVSIERTLRKTGKAKAIGLSAAAQADILRKWLTSLPDHNGAWAAPAWFVEGFLRGYDAWGPGV
jgi:hypothetical protein